MDLGKTPTYDERSLAVVNSRGRLLVLRVPFQVKCIEEIGIIKVNRVVYVEATRPHPDFLICYLILNEWLPYSHFHVILVLGN